MIKEPGIERLLELQKLLLKFNQVERVTHRQNARAEFMPENDTEHSYNLALSAWFLTECFPELNKNLVIRLALVHDLVEIHAGDTYIYADDATIAKKHDREKAALEKLRKDWSDFSDMLEDIELYEQRASPEAKFVYALDKIMPIMQIYIHDGYTWKQEGITLERLNQVKRSKVNLSPEIAPLYDQLFKLLLNHPEHFK